MKKKNIHNKILRLRRLKNALVDAGIENTHYMSEEEEFVNNYKNALSKLPDSHLKWMLSNVGEVREAATIRYYIIYIDLFLKIANDELMERMWLT